MAILVQTDFTRTGTIRTICYVYDDDEALVDATSVSITIKDPDGTLVVDDVAMTKNSTGMYEYFYTPATTAILGNYQIECDILDGSYHTIRHSHFNLSKGISE